MTLFIIITLIFLIISLEHPDFMFWLALTIWVDPGGFIYANLTRSAVGGLQLTDLTFVLLMIPLLSPKIKISDYFRTEDNRRIFKFLLFYTIVYHIFIFGFLAPGGSIKTLLDVLQYERLTLWGFAVIIPSYIFFRRNYKLLVKFAVVTSIILVILYLMYLLFNIQILPIWTYNRGLGTDVERIAMLNYGYAYWFVYIFFVMVIMKINLPKKKWIYFIGISLIFAVILTLTRRSILLLIYAPMVIFFLHQKFLNRSIFSVKAVKIVFPFLLMFIVLIVVQPNYGNVLYLVLNSSVQVASGGEGAMDDGRIVHDIPRHLERFKLSPIIGYGYDVSWYDNDPATGGLSANDVPLTAALGMFGIAGLLLFSAYYYFIIKLLFQTFRILGELFRKNLAQKNAIVFTIAIILLVTFIALYTLNFMGLFADLIVGATRVSILVNVGILLASRDILHNKLINYQTESP